MKELSRERSERRFAKSEALFWSKVRREESGCWIWTGSRSDTGYGSVRWVGFPAGAHQVSFLLTRGFVPECTCHRCDNRPCVNPFHLFAGTQRDNVYDRISKGRNNYVRGSQIGASKLKESQVVEILSLRFAFPRSYLASVFNVSWSTIHSIQTKKTWRHIPIPDDATRKNESGNKVAVYRLKEGQ